MIQASTLLWFSRANGEPSDAVIANLAKHAHVYLWSHTESAVNGHFDPAWNVAIKDRIRSVNPRTKVGLYIGDAAQPLALADGTPTNPQWEWLADADLMHRPDGSPCVVDLPASPNGGPYRRKLMNIVPRANRFRLAHQFAQLVIDNDFDGLLWDGIAPSSYTAVLGPYYGCPSGTLELPTADPATWAIYVRAYALQIRRALALAGRELWVNGVAPFAPTASPADQIPGVGMTNYLDWASGALAEGFTSVVSPSVDGSAPVDFETVADYLDLAQRATAKRRRIMLIASIGAYKASYPSTPVVDSLELQRYITALYLLIEEPPYTSLGYTWHAPWRGWDSWAWDGGHGAPEAFWSPDWGREYGIPTTNCTPDPASPRSYGPTLFTRGFEYGTVVVNPTPTPRPVKVLGTSRVWDAVDGPLVTMTDDPATWYVVPPRSGIFFWQVS